jgi:ATP synthase, F1 delta subunit
VINVDNNMIAQRYATAIYEIAKENNKQDEIREILNLLTEKYNEDENFRNFLSNPIVTTEEKEKFLKKAFSFINPESFNIINYLVSKDRMNYISLIRDNYVSFLYKEESKLPVVAIFTKELSKAQKEKLIKKLEKKYGKKIVLNLEIDESIIGGGIIKVGNDVINGSIKHQIEDMKRIF